METDIQARMDNPPTLQGLYELRDEHYNYDIVVDDGNVIEIGSRFDISNKKTSDFELGQTIHATDPVTGDLVCGVIKTISYIPQLVNGKLTFGHLGVIATTNEESDSTLTFINIIKPSSTKQLSTRTLEMLQQIPETELAKLPLEMLNTLPIQILSNLSSQHISKLSPEVVIKVRNYNRGVYNVALNTPEENQKLPDPNVKIKDEEWELFKNWVEMEKSKRDMERLQRQGFIKLIDGHIENKLDLLRQQERRQMSDILEYRERMLNNVIYEQ